jgi:hypothetical protein
VLNPAVSQELSELIDQLLAKDPNGRLQTAAEVVGRLTSIENRTGQATFAATDDASHTSLVGSPAMASPLRISRKRQSLWIVLGGTCAAALIAAAVIIKIMHPDGTTTTFEAEDGSRVEIAPGHGKNKDTLIAPADPVTPKKVWLGQVLYEKDFGTFDEDWAVQDEGFVAAFKNGSLSMKSLPTGTVWRTHLGKDVRLDDADIEVVGRATRGTWGVAAWNFDKPRRGLLIVVNSDRQIVAWMGQTTGDPGKYSSTRDKIDVKSRLPASKSDLSYSTLRAVIRNDTVSVWLDGKPACDNITLEKPLGESRISLVGSNDERGLFDCDFKSLRISRAGQ